MARYPPSRVVAGNRSMCFTQAMSGWMAYSREPIFADELVARAAMKKVDHDHVVEYTYQGTVATTNGKSVWVSATPAKARAGHCTSPQALPHFVSRTLRWRFSTA